MFDLFQLNVHKSKEATALLTKSFHNKKNFIYLLTEPHVNGKGILPGYPRSVNVYHKGLYTRSCIISLNQNLWFNPNYSSRDITTCLWKTDSDEIPEIYLSSVYLDILNTDDEFFPTELMKLVNYCNLKNKPLIISMDSNSHSTLWGLETNRRGEILEDFIFTHNLNLENVGYEPTFIGRDCQTRVDITLTSNLLNIENWKVLNDLTLSDHRLISFSVDINQNKRKKIICDTKSVDWEKFRERLQGINYVTPRKINRDWLDYSAKNLTDNINKALEKVCKKKVIDTRVKKPYFWSHDIENLKKLMRSSWRSFCRSRDLSQQEAYKELKLEFRREVRKAKSQCWKDFVSETDNIVNMSKLHKIIQRIQNRPVGLLVGDDPNADLNPESTMNILIDTHFPGNLKDSSDNTSWKPSKDIISIQEFSFITVDKVGWALGSFGPQKAAGPDGLKPICLKNLDKNSLERLVVLYQASLALGYVPRCWRETKVIFIPKPGKDDYSKAKSFRPISLSSFLLKALERVVLNEVEREYLEINPINPNQHGFCKGSSCDSALSNMVNGIEKSVCRNQFALGIFLDISGAFDNLDPEAALRGMKAKGISKPIIKWYGHYLFNRYINTSIGGLEARRKLTRGTPQGGVLSPVIWNLAFDELLDMFDEGPVKVTGFADDAGLLITGPDPQSLADIGQKAVDKAVDWGHKNGLTFGAAKTVIVLFKGRGKCKMPKPMKVDGITIEYSKTVKYLGITLDDKLTFNEHIKDKVKKGKGLLMKTKQAIGQLWGPSPELMRWSYTGIVRPMVTYGSVIWAHKAKDHQKALDRLQRLAMLNITHILRSAPTRGLEVIMGIPPLDLHLMRLAEATSIRIKDRFNPNWDGLGHYKVKGHLRRLQDLNSKLGITYQDKSLVKNTLERELIRLWQERWDSEDRFRQTKLWFPKIDHETSKWLFKLDRCSYGHIIQIVTGHNYLNYHLFNCKKVENPSCRYCDEDNETSWHLLAECPKFAQLRMGFSGDHKVPPGINQVSAFLTESSIDTLLSPKG
jgi:hypothetical protein